MSRVIVVLDANKNLDRDNWRASEVAASVDRLTLQHDGTSTIVPKRASDQFIKSTRATNIRNGTTDSAEIHSVT